MTDRKQHDRESLPELADRLREWLEDVLRGPEPEPVPVPVPVRRPRHPGPQQRRRRRRR